MIVAVNLLVGNVNLNKRVNVNVENKKKNTLMPGFLEHVVATVL